MNQKEFEEELDRLSIPMMAAFDAAYERLMKRLNEEMKRMRHLKSIRFKGFDADSEAGS